MLGGLLAIVPAVAPAADVPVIEITPGAGQSPSSVRYGQSAGSQESQLLLMVQQLQDEVRMLRGQVESQQYELDRLKQQQDDRYRDLDRRLSLLITGGAQTPSVPPAATAPVDQAEPQLTPPVPADAPNTAAGDDPAYQAAFALVRERKFDEAAASFERFVVDYPSSPRLANAYYWLGEIYLAQQKLEPSRQAFARVVEGFADSPKVPDALYKLGVLHHQLGNMEQSARYMAQVIQEFPNSSAARLAQNFGR